MRNDNQFNDRHISPNLEEYLTNEVTQYYGEDIIKQAEGAITDTPAPHRSSNKLLTALAVFCAIMFISGAMLFSGMLLTSSRTEFESTASKNSSVAVYDSNTDTQIDTEKTTSDTASAYSVHSSSVSTDSTSNADKSISDTESDTELTTSDTASAYSEPSSEKSSDGASQAESSIIYFSMPEYPDEGNISVTDTDINNNAETNPYDNVTTGSKAHVWLGVLLMSLSLLSATAISKYKFDNDY